MKRDPLDPFDNLFDAIFRTFDAFGDAVSSMGDALSTVAGGQPVFEATSGKAGEDAQRDAVYAWHYKYIVPYMKAQGVGGLMPVGELIGVANHIFQSRGFNTPRIARSPDTVATGNHQLITLPDHMMRLDVILHEAAHGLMDYYVPSWAEVHGPEFVCIFSVLVEEWAKARWSWLGATLKEAGVRRVSPGSIGLPRRPPRA